MKSEKYNDMMKMVNNFRLLICQCQNTNQYLLQLNRKLQKECKVSIAKADFCQSYLYPKLFDKNKVVSMAKINNRQSSRPFFSELVPFSPTLSDLSGIVFEIQSKNYDKSSKRITNDNSTVFSTFLNSQCCSSSLNSDHCLTNQMVNRTSGSVHNSGRTFSSFYWQCSGDTSQDTMVSNNAIDCSQLAVLPEKHLQTLIRDVQKENFQLRESNAKLLQKNKIQNNCLRRQKRQANLVEQKMAQRISTENLIAELKCNIAIKQKEFNELREQLDFVQHESAIQKMELLSYQKRNTS